MMFERLHSRRHAGREVSSAAHRRRCRLGLLFEPALRFDEACCMSEKEVELCTRQTEGFLFAVGSQFDIGLPTHHWLLSTTCTLSSFRLLKQLAQIADKLGPKH